MCGLQPPGAKVLLALPLMKLMPFRLVKDGSCLGNEMLGHSQMVMTGFMSSLVPVVQATYNTLVSTFFGCFMVCQWPTKIIPVARWLVCSQR